MTNFRFLNFIVLSVLLLSQSAVFAEENIQKQAIEAFAAKDYATAKSLFMSLAEEGDMISQFGLAKIYRFGLGDKPDYTQALHWYEKAAMHNYGVAQSHLGEMYENGLGITKDLQMAKSWYQIACSNRCSEGCRHLQRLNEQ